MISSRVQAWVGLAIGGVALVIGLIASRGDDDDPAARLERFGREQARRRVEAARFDRGVDVDLDRAALEDLDPKPASDLDVEVTALLVRVDGLEMSNDELAARAQTVAAATPDTAVTIRAHPDVEYARVVEILDLLRKAGLTQIAFTAAPSP